MPVLMLSMPSCSESSTGKNIFDLFDNELVSREILWDNCLSFSCDNASVMTGRFKGVAAFMKEKQKQLYIAGCLCHLIHLAAEKAYHMLPGNMEELLIDIFFYLDKSSKRHQSLKKFQILCSIDTHKILKHVSTRWLSLHIVITRTLEQWPALLEFFKAEIKSSSTRLSSDITAPTTQSTSRSKQQMLNSYIQAAEAKCFNKIIKVHVVCLSSIYA